jgi:hypothetical protein
MAPEPDPASDERVADEAADTERPAPTLSA